MNYFPMVCVMGLDMAGFVALAWYVPGDFAQYPGPDRYIWTVDDGSEADALGLLFDASQSYDLLNYSIRVGQCFELDRVVCENGSVNELCNWFDHGGYCTYDNDKKLSGTFKGEGTLWWTCYPIVFFFTQLVWSLYFLMKYQRRPKFGTDIVYLGNKTGKENVTGTQISPWVGRNTEL